MKKKLSILLIIIGIILLLLPTISKLVLNSIRGRSLDYLDQLSTEDIEENLKQAGNFDFNGVRDISPTRTLLGLSNVNKNLIIGQLLIPSIELNLPVLKGVDESNLNAGAATMKEDQVMGQGNYALAGHYIKGKNTLFGGLMDVKKGDIIRITDKRTVYEYKVYHRLVTKDSDITLLSDKRADERAKPIISLMTCYYSSKTGKRFFVLGELVGEYPYNKNLFTRTSN